MLEGNPMKVVMLAGVFCMAMIAAGLVLYSDPAADHTPLAAVTTVEEAPECTDASDILEAVRAEVKREIADPEKSSYQVMRELTTRAVQSFHDALADEERFSELRLCRVAEGDCREIEGDALAAVLAWPFRDELFNDVQGLAELREAYGSSELERLLHEEIDEAYSRSPDAVERIVALALLESRQSSDPRPLRPGVFSDLSERPAAEAMLLLTHYERAPVHDMGVVQSIARIASEPSVEPELRRRALRSLGFAETAQELGRAIELFEADGLLTRQSALTTVAPALARCGIACGYEFEALARGQNPAGRLAALWAAARLDAAIRDLVVDGIAEALGGHESLTHEEHDQLAYLDRVTSR